MRGFTRIKHLVSKLGWKHRAPDAITFSGNYASWQEAEAECQGYGDPLILERVRNSALKVKNGLAKYERDSVLFDQVHYSLPLLAFLLYVTSRSGNKLSLVDFGGGLGSTYYQNRQFLAHLSDLQWKIVEQEHFVSIGIKDFQSQQLSFFYTIEDSLAFSRSNVLLLSSVLPYLSKPYEFLKNLRKYAFDFIILDRTPFFLSDQPDRLTIETVPESVYSAKYPAWFFNRRQFLDSMNADFELFQEFDSWESWNIDNARSQSKAFLFVRR